MKRAAIYARYSTDLQNERSVEDQVALCRAYAEREKLQIVATFDDRARSGGSMLGRDGLIQMLAQANSGAFDVIVVEALDRLSRDMADLATIHKQLKFKGIELRAVHDGRADTVLIGLRGLVGQLFREDGAKKVRRGMQGVVREGRHAGGKPYGYRTSTMRGRLEIDPVQAAVVRRILTEYADGRPPREIAGDLNREGIAPPRGRTWNASTINGSGQRGNGIVRNEIYIGRIVWGKVRMDTNPETGRRISRPADGSEVMTADAPELRLVDDALWQRVQAINEAKAALKSHQKRRPPHLLSGLLRCGCCGSGMSVHDRDKTGKTRVRCSAVRESGVCTNRRIIYLPAIERAVVDGMREQLRDPRYIEIYVRRYNSERQRLASTAVRNRASLEARLAERQREFDRVMNAYVKGFITEAEAEQQIPELRRERDRIAAELAAAGEDPKVLTLHPGAINDYLRQVDELAATLADHAHEGMDKLTQMFRSLVHSVTVYPNGPREGFEVEVKGRLAELVGGHAFPTGRFSGVNVVAE
ncbi:recombinase family protein, partial [Microvirga sp. SYSU G3D207]